MNPRRFLLAITIAAALARCSSTMPGDVTSNHQPFDYASHDCQASLQAPKADEVDVRYLGSGGAYVAWRGDAILLGPFFSNPPLLANLFGRMRHDRPRIAAHLRDVAPASVRAIVTGHSHYDHFGDVPVVARDCAPSAEIFTNADGVAMLHGDPALYARARPVTAGKAFEVHAADGRVVMRIHPIASEHAPQVCRSHRWPCHISNCHLQSAWNGTFEDEKLRDFCGGDAFAYVIDLLDGDAVRFRLYYNDAAPDHGLGVPAMSDGIPFDVAILCIASYHLVDGYPELVLAGTHPRYVVISHYEDFFSKSEGRWRFVPLLSGAGAKRFVTRMLATHAIANDLASSKNVCGATGDGWSMPVPGEQLLFTARR